MKRLEIDYIACDGYGYCADLLPDNIELDDWGYPIVVDELVDDDGARRARRAARVCPVAALRLEALRERIRGEEALRRTREGEPATR